MLLSNDLPSPTSAASQLPGRCTEAGRGGAQSPPILKNSGYASTFEADIAHDPILGAFVYCIIACICESCLQDSVCTCTIQFLCTIPQYLPSNHLIMSCPIICTYLYPPQATKPYQKERKGKILPIKFHGVYTAHPILSTPPIPLLFSKFLSCHFDPLKELTNQKFGSCYDIIHVSYTHHSCIAGFFVN